MIIKTIYQDSTGFTEEKILEVSENDFDRKAYELLFAVNTFYLNENIKELQIIKGNNNEKTTVTRP